MDDAGTTTIDPHKLLTKITFVVFLILITGFFVVKMVPGMTGLATATVDSASDINNNIQEVRNSDFRIPAKLSIFILFFVTICIIGMHFERKEHGL